MFELYSERARRLIFLARLKAGERGAEAIDIDDLLVGFIIEDQGEFEKVLSDDLAHDRPLVQAGSPLYPSFLPPVLARDLLGRLQALGGQSQPVPKQPDLPLSKSAKVILGLADSLRDELKQRDIEPLHMLAAILGDESSRVALIFREAGITRENVIQFLREER